MKLVNSFSLFATSILLGISNWTYAIDASPMPIKDKQPNGDWVTLEIKGDEHFNWQEDAYGYTVLKDAGWYKYAQVGQNGRLSASEHIVGQVDPTKLKLAPGLLPLNTARANVDGAHRLELKKRKLKGVKPHLVVLMRFAGHEQKALPSAEQIDTLFNGPKDSGIQAEGAQVKGEKFDINERIGLAPSGSIKQLFKQNSYGQLEIVSSVQKWIDLPHSQAYYASNGKGSDRVKEAIEFALTQLEGLVDFTQFDSNGDGHLDGVTFLHSGYSAEWGGTDSEGVYYKDRIWSHQRALSFKPWNSQQGIQVSEYAIAPALWGSHGNEITRIGVIAHEMGHQLGLPDLYGSIDNPQDLAYDFMANAWDLQASQHCPGQLSLWSKMQLGWQAPQIIGEDGRYQLRSANFDPDGYLVRKASAGDGYYWLIENRQAEGFDCAMSQSGLLIWQVNKIKPYIDKRGITRSEQISLVTKRVDNLIAQQDKSYTELSVVLDDELTMKNIVKNDELMSFCLNQCMLAPTHLKVKAKRMLRQGFDVELSWVDNADNETQILIERCRVVVKNKQKSCKFKPHANVAANVTRYKDRVNFGQYLYRVKAVNENSSSSYSKPAST